MEGKIIKYLKKNVWYHGTNLLEWKKICALGILANYNIGNELDFGYGFYLTPEKDQAEYYISKRIEFESKEIPGLPIKKLDDKDIPIIIEFTFCPWEWHEKYIIQQ